MCFVFFDSLVIIIFEFKMLRDNSLLCGYVSPFGDTKLLLYCCCF